MYTARESQLFSLCNGYKTSSSVTTAKPSNSRLRHHLQGAGAYCAGPTTRLTACCYCFRRTVAAGPPSSNCRINIARDMRREHGALGDTRGFQVRRFLLVAWLDPSPSQFRSPPGRLLRSFVSADAMPCHRTGTK